MRGIVAASALCLGLAFTASAQAASSARIDLPGVTQPGFTQVVEGCGRGGHRDRYGRCRPNYQPVVRRCPYGTHPTPYGCRRNY